MAGSRSQKPQTHSAARTTPLAPGTFDKMGEIWYFPAVPGVKIKGKGKNVHKMRAAKILGCLGRMWARDSYFHDPGYEHPTNG